MKFTRISLHNIASWRGEHVLDLSGENRVTQDGVGYRSVDGAPLFLIHGVTGAGKSSILDAILLALFGRTLRLSSDAKKPTTEETAQDHPAQLISRGEGFMEAKLDVELAGDIYRFGYYVQRAHKKPDGNIQQAVRTISKLDPVTGKELEVYETEKKDAWDEIYEKVLGDLTFEEFSRSVVLAQNEFSRFFDADPKEKSALIAKLTGTEIYARYGEAIKTAAADAKRALEALEHQGHGLLTDEDVIEARARLDAHEASRAREREERDATNVSLDKLRKHAAARGELAPLEKRVEEEEARGEISEEEREALERHRLVRGKEEDLRKLKDRRTELAGKRRDLDEVVEKLAGFDPPTATQTAARRDVLVDLLEAHASLVGEVDAARRRREEVAKARDAKAVRLAECEREERARRDTYESSRHAELVEYVEHAPLLFGLEAGAVLTEAHRRRADAYLSKHANLWPSSSSNRFADHLELVEELVDASTDARTYIALEQQKRDLARLEEEIDGLDKELEDATAEEAKARDKLERFGEEQGSKDALEEELEQVNAALDAKKEREELLEKKTRSEQEIDSLEETEQLLEKNLAALFEQLGDDIETLLGHLLGDAEVDRIERGSRDLLEAEANLEKAHARHASALLAEEQLREMEKRLGLEVESGFDAILAALEKRHGALEDDVKRLDRQIDDLKETLEVHERLVEEGVRTRIEEARARHGRLVLLNKVAGGEKMQQRKQRLNLSRLIRNTNERLSRLTSGRLALKQTQATNTAEFDLYDRRADHRGSRYTLSGGEKFLVSLALALGLRDMQGMNAGKMPRSMFIDEGFGALDGESRDALLQVLTELGSENDTQLGIISHVSEIKEQIEVSIEIKKENELSRFEEASAAS